MSQIIVTVIVGDEKTTYSIPNNECSCSLIKQIALLNNSRESTKVIDAAASQPLAAAQQHVQPYPVFVPQKIDSMGTRIIYTYDKPFIDIGLRESNPAEYINNIYNVCRTNIGIPPKPTPGNIKSYKACRQFIYAQINIYLHNDEIDKLYEKLQA